MRRTAAEADRAEGRAEGYAESIAHVLEHRFDRVPARLMRSIQAITDLAVCRALLRTAIDVPSLEAFERELAAATARRSQPRARGRAGS